MTENKKVPTSRFKEFKDKWNTYKIDELFQVKVAGDLKKDTFSKIYSKEYPYPLLW